MKCYVGPRWLVRPWSIEPWGDPTPTARFLARMEELGYPLVEVERNRWALAMVSRKYDALIFFENHSDADKMEW